MLVNPGKEMCMEQTGPVRNGHASVGLAALWTGMFATLVQPSVSTLWWSIHGKALLQGHLMIGHLVVVHLEAILLIEVAHVDWCWAYVWSANKWHARPSLV